LVKEKMYAVYRVRAMKVAEKGVKFSESVEKGEDVVKGKK